MRLSIISIYGDKISRAPLCNQWRIASRGATSYAKASFRMSYASSGRSRLRTAHRAVRSSQEARDPACGVRVPRGTW
jgi:hypothetical protein